MIRSSSDILVLCLVILAPIAAVFALIQILSGPRLISKLMLRYLMKRRIAWISLIAVMLCTAMVLVVISVMGGWLRWFRESNHALVGDIVVYRNSLDGFSHYQEMIDEIKKIPEVKEATASLHTFGLVVIQDQKAQPVQVIGYDIKSIGDVNGFINSLHLQKDVLNQKADEFAKQAERQGKLAVTRVAAAQAADNRIDEFEANALQKDASQLAGEAATFRKKAADFPSWDLPMPASVYRDRLPKAKKDPATWGGIVVGVGVIGFQEEKDRSDKDFIYSAPVKLTVLRVSAESGGSTLEDKTSSNNYWIVDDSHTGVYQEDMNNVYLPFDVLQNELDMQGGTVRDAETGEPVTEPARCTEIIISIRKGEDLNATRDKVQAVVDSVAQTNGLFYGRMGELKAETWEERQQDFLNAVEHEKSLLVVLFAVISVVAVFLIFCIFFMIVMEKTRDIGIIKSVGATGYTVAGIFLGYGLVIGVLGGGMGLLLAYLIVHNINALHQWMGDHMGIHIWNAKTYLFDTIPNTMSRNDVVVIVSIAVLSSVLGALFPAIRAARMNPVESLRWE